MKNSVLDVLMYLLDNFMDSPMEAQAEYAVDELAQAGFEPKDIDKAFGWLEQLMTNSEETQAAYNIKDTGNRQFTFDELTRLNAECLDFLLMLEHNQIINSMMRELILEQVLALEPKELTLTQFKRIIMMVLMNLPNTERAVIWLESFINDEKNKICH